MSVAENIFLGREPDRMGFLDYKKLYRQTEELLAKLKIPISPKTKMKNLRVADQQMVEIAQGPSPRTPRSSSWTSPPPPSPTARWTACSR